MTVSIYGIVHHTDTHTLSFVDVDKFKNERRRTIRIKNEEWKVKKQRENICKTPKIRIEMT